MTRPIVVAGGGTGGHVFAMQAVAEQLLAAGVAASDLRFVGSRRGQESELLAASPVALTQLPGRGIERSWRPRAILQNVAATSALAWGIVRAIELMVRWRPRAVVSLGGYAALAADVAAVTCARRLVLVDLDATPSAVHRLLHRRARRICTAFASADARSVTTGAPLRGSITAISRDGVRTNVAASAARDALCWTVVVMTGSLGAKSVNRATIELAQLWRARGDVRLVHVTGRRDYEWCVAQWQSESSDRLRYEQVAFADMATLWSEADLAVTRAGATTVAELTYLAIPAVLVPLPGAPGDHQTHNANALVHAGGAVMVADRAVSGESLAVLLDELLNLDRLRIMSDASRTLRHEDAAAAIAREVLAVAT